jgi:hypothetical protein
LPALSSNKFDGTTLSLAFFAIPQNFFPIDFSKPNFPCDAAGKDALPLLRHAPVDSFPGGLIWNEPASTAIPECTLYRLLDLFYN